MNHDLEQLQQSNQLRKHRGLKRIQDEDPDSGDKPDWDEVVVNNFKMQKIHVTEEFSPDFAEDKDIYGFPFELYYDNGDIVDYIQRKTKSLKL